MPNEECNRNRKTFYLGFHFNPHFQLCFWIKGTFLHHGYRSSGIRGILKLLVHGSANINYGQTSRIQDVCFCDKLFKQECLPHWFCSSSVLFMFRNICAQQNHNEGICLCSGTNWSVSSTTIWAMVAFVAKMTELDLLLHVLPCCVCVAGERWERLFMHITVRINGSAPARLFVSHFWLLSDRPDCSYYHRLSGITLNSATHATCIARQHRLSASLKSGAEVGSVSATDLNAPVSHLFCV